MSRLAGLLPPPGIRHSPLTRAEFRHQRYVLNTTRSGWLWVLIALVMLVPALLAALFYAVIALLDLRFPVIEGDIAVFLVNFSTTMLLVMNVAQYLVVTLVTLSLAGQSIAREHLNRTWDVLLLTNVDARTLVWSKWWASLWAVWGDHAMIGLLRVGLIGWLVVLLQGLPYPIANLPAGVGYFLPLAVLALAFTVVDAGLSAALGLAGPLAGLPNAVTMTAVIAVRLLSSAAAAWVLFNVIHRMQLYGGATYLPPALLGFIALAALTWALLWLAERLALRAQVSPSAAPTSAPPSHGPRRPGHGAG